MEKRLKRSQGHIIAGVCGGMADYLNVDPTLVRVLYVILSIVSTGFPGVLVYIICWAVMPLDQTGEQ